jgi:serine/threonine-protein kinase PpkA
LTRSDAADAAEWDTLGNHPDTIRPLPVQRMQPDETDAPLPAPEAPAPPAESAALPGVDGYRMVRRLGQGGMAVVYLAVQVSLDREVAVKVMDPAASEDEAQATRFEHEARIIAKLEHPGIVGIHEVGRTREGQLYYVMPYLARGDLSQRDYRDSEARIIDLLRHLLDALGYAHARGIVHRDVKAENVLFNNADRPQLTDFGIALSRRPGRARITTDGLALGSGGYMSPEQARGEPVDGRADLYSLGVLTYELLTGELPFHSEDPLALALMHAQDPVPALPAELQHWQRFVETAMAKSPEKRFRNAQAMQRALDPLARRLQPPDGLRAFFAHAFWRRPPGLIVAGTLVALSALLLAFALGPLMRGLTAPSAPGVAADASDVPLTISPEAVQPTPEEIAAAVALRLAEARAQVDAGQLVAPAGANAAETYLAVLRTDPGNAEAVDGLDRVLAALATPIVASIDRGERDTTRERFEQARLLAESAGLQARPAWPALQTQVRDALLARGNAALAALDRNEAQAWASMPGELGIEDEAVRALRARIAAMPEAGSRLQDRGGPELSYLPATIGRSRIEASIAIMRTEVTRGEYAAFVAQTRRAPARCRNRLSPLQLLDRRQWNDPGFEQAGNHPAVCVSYDDARAYADWLSRRTGQRYRLPTLQEWRHAAQGLGATDLCAQGNVADRNAGGTSALECSDRHRYTAPVRSYRAGALALHDLGGNVGEWTLACGEAGNPIARLLENEACPRRAAAGLSWRDGRGAVPPSHLQMLEPERGYDDVGFRLVRELPAS